MSDGNYKIALVGNPNCGKSSLFNKLTGLNQRTGNHPGVTVTVDTGKISSDIDCIDLPGAYSLHATSDDEYILTNILLDKSDSHHPDQILYIIDVTQLEKHFLLLTQLIDLGFNPIVVLNMIDEIEKGKVSIDIGKLEKQFPGLEIIPVSTRSGQGIQLLKDRILLKKPATNTAYKIFNPGEAEQEAIAYMRKTFNYTNDYQSILCMHHSDRLVHHDSNEKKVVDSWKKEHHFNSLRLQIDETLDRFNEFAPRLKKTYTYRSLEDSFTSKADKIFTHRFWGPIIFVLAMIFVFQAIFAWATFPMDLIENSFSGLSIWVGDFMPEHWTNDLMTKGIIPGLAGVLIFIPQIAILFFLITLLEEVGYMSRAVYLFDRVMQKVGLNGRSIVALISSGACAIPAIMSTRSISNSKERLLTILVSPFISCSARIPVYAILVAFVVPSISVFGIFNAQGLVFLGLYMIGIVMAMLVAWILHKTFKSKGKSHLMMELPGYKIPNFNNVFLRVYHSVKSFVLEAGKIILIISIALWFLSSYGPGDSMQNAREEAIIEMNSSDIPDENLIASKQLEASFAGRIGKFIEPAIEPLGYDWKIGIALFTSFAAREVFVGTMATIYSLGSDDELTMRQRMRNEINPITGNPRYDLPTALSLLIFYVLAMQCMSTLAVVKKETGTWKWPIIQFFGMTSLAYLGAFIVYQLF